MKGKISIILIVFLLFSLWAITALPQAKQQRTPLYIVEETIAKPPKVSEYEAHIKKAVDLFAKYNHPYPVYAFSTDDLHYISVFPVKSFADMENTYKAFGELAKKAGEEFQAMIKSAEGTLEYSKYFIVRYIPQLSYIPDKPRLKPEESNFIFCEYFYIEPGKEGEFAEVCKKWIALYKSKNISDGWEIYIGSIGTETPLFIVFFRSKSAADYHSQEEKTWELLGEEGEALKEKTLSITRKFEQKSGRYRPDLTYIPKKEKPTK